MGVSPSHPDGLLGCEFTKAVIYTEEATARAALMEKHAELLLAKGTLRLMETRIVARDVVVITFSFPARLKLIPGGHVRISGKRISRNYTPFHITDSSFSIAVKQYPKGAVSRDIYSAKTGTFFRVAGPLEPFFTVVGVRFDVLWLIGGGTGIAPMYSMARSCAESRTCAKIVLLGCFRDGGDSILCPQMAQLMAEFPQLVESVVVLSRSDEQGLLGMKTMTGRFCAAHAALLPKPSQAVICGPPGFDGAVTDVLASVHLFEEHIAVL